MRIAWRPIPVPTAVAFWTLLVAGHVASTLVPLPARVETAARTLALGLGAVSLLVGWIWQRRGMLGARAARWERTEALFGAAAALLAGVALGAEADRAAWPLPVHPRE